VVKALISRPWPGGCGRIPPAQGFRTTEHQVLKEVADAGDALEFVAGAHMVVELQGDRGHPGVG